LCTGTTFCVDASRQRVLLVNGASRVASEDQSARKGDAVSATVLYMSMSLDGFVARPNVGPDNGLG
jgi:hypothetical protein